MHVHNLLVSVRKVEKELNPAVEEKRPSYAEVRRAFVLFYFLSIGQNVGFNARNECKGIYIYIYEFRFDQTVH